ncbi:MAG: hypothetical protein ACP5E4_03685 [Candidatus Aenigmatarchaeota archaeon]
MGYVPAGSKLVFWNELYKRGAKPGLKNLAYTYEGKNPEKIIPFLPKLVKLIFAPTTWQQKEIRVSEGAYTSMWYLFRDLDPYTYFRVDIELSVKYKDGKGTAKIKMGEPVIITEYSQDTLWQKSFFYEIIRMAWHNVFYRKKLEAHMDWGRAQVSCFEEKLLNFFDELNNGRE